MRRLVFSLFIFAIVFVKPVGALTITPNDVLEIRFTRPGGVLYGPDTLILNLYGGSTTDFTQGVARLFDGDQLLGVETDFGTYYSWKSPSSLWNFRDPTVIDFSSLTNGTIDGRIELSIATGSLTLNNVSMFSLDLLQAAGPSGGFVASWQPTITKVSVTAIPEPTTILLMSCGLLGLLGICVKRRRKAK